MRGLGMATVAATAVAAAVIVAVGVLSIPDIKRYFKMRSM